MASAQTFILRAGELSRRFAFGNMVAPLAAVTTNQASLPIYKESVYSAFQGIVTGTGAITATITIQGSNDDNTGQGYTPGGANGPGFFVATTNASTTLSCPAAQFTQAMVGAEVRCPGVAPGTTVASVAPNGVSLVMSAAAAATSTGVQANLHDTLWVATPLGVITLNGTAKLSDGFQSQSSWRYIRAVISNITGTGTTVSVLMGI